MKEHKISLLFHQSFQGCLDLLLLPVNKEYGYKMIIFPNKITYDSIPVITFNVII